MSYTKYHDAWSNSDSATAEAFNHIEGQWAEIKEVADAHNHDTRYYPKATADITFFSTSFYSGFDADTLDGTHFSGLTSASMPLGAILIWSGTDANIPTGWAICNGGSSTLDLRDLFIIGSGGAYQIGNTNPNRAYSVAISGTITVAPHSVTAGEMPLHTHNYYDATDVWGQSGPNGSASATGSSQYYYSRTTSPTGSSTGHDHTGNSITLNNLTFMPYYYALYYIMKVA